MFMFQLVAHLSNVPHVRREVHPTNGQAEVLLNSIVSEGFQIMNVMDVLFFSIHKLTIVTLLHPPIFERQLVFM